jgi:Ala-tRNA(Pro) deacylase
VILEATYTRLVAFLDQHNARYRLIDHAPEGRTEIVSAMRGNALSQAAKCIVLMVKLGKKVTRHILAVIPGDARVDLDAIKALMDGTYISFASPEIAEKLAGSVAGTILPFAFNPELELIVDPSLLENEEIFFNAARLDRSMALKTSDYRALSGPRIERIVLPEGGHQN